MATEVETPVCNGNGSEKHEEIIETAPAGEQPQESVDPQTPQPAATPTPTTNGDEVKKQKSAVRFRMPKNLRNLFAKKAEAGAVPVENGHEQNGQNGQNGHSEVHEEAKAQDAVSIGCAGKMRNVFKKVKSAHVDKRPIEKPDENAKMNDDCTKKEKLDGVIKNNLIGAGLADRAAVSTFDGLILAHSSEFEPTAEQVKDCLKLVNGKSEDAIGKSFKFGDTEYVCSESVESASLFAKHQVKTEGEEATTDAAVLVQLSKAHVVIAAYTTAQRSSTHADDVKSKMNEITKSLSDEEL